MHAEHRIDNLIVDLSFTTTRLARHEKAALAEWLSDDLLPALDNLFSRISPGKQILRFETLEFNFGNLDSRTYQQNIREQLLAQFVRLLQSQLIALPSSSSSQSFYAQDDQHSQVALAQTLEYLITGQIRAHHSNENIFDSSAVNEKRLHLSVDQPVSQQALEKDQEITKVKDENGQVLRAIKSIIPSGIHELLLEQVLAQHNIAELLRQFSDLKILTQRLLKQFSELQRLEILRQLIPQHMGTVIALLDLLQFAEEKYSTSPAETNTISSGLLRNAIWQELILNGLKDEFVAENLWLGKIINQIATEMAISKNQLQQYLLSIQLPESSEESSLVQLKRRIAKTAENIAQDDIAAIVGERSIVGDNQSDVNQQQSPDYLRQLIAKAFVSGDAYTLLEIWPQLTAREPQLLSAALKHYLTRAEIRQQVMRKFPLAMQADIVALLAPALNVIFQQLQLKAEQLIDAVHKLSNSIDSNNKSTTDLSSEQLQRSLWELAISLILNSKTGSSDTDYLTGENTFVINLATNYAQLNSIDPHLLQKTWLALLNDKITVTSWDSKSDNAFIVSSLDISEKTSDSEFTKALLSEKITHGNIARESHLPFTPIDENKSPDTGENSNIEKKFPVIEQDSFHNVSDHQLFDLCLRLKSGALLWEQIPHNVELLRRLISSYIRLGHSATTENCADFVAAIDTQAQSTQSITNFYTLVLQALIADRLVDLEAIAVSVNNKNIISTQPETRIEIIAEVKTDNVKTQSLNPFANNTINEIDLDVIATQLQQGKIQLESINLNSNQLSQLIDTYVYKNNLMAKEVQEELILAIHQFESEVGSKANYYKNVLQQLISKKGLDLSAIGEKLRKDDQESKTILSPSLVDGAQGLQPKTTEVSMSTLSTTKVPLLNVSAIEKSQFLPISSFNTSEIVQLLSTKPESIARLQQLIFNNAQWHVLVAELIQKVNPGVIDSADELLQSINSFSRKAINTGIYYRLVINALLEQQPIDLEVFAVATTATTGNQTNAKSEQHKLDQILDNSRPIENQSPVLDAANTISADSAIDYSQLTGSDKSLHKPAISLAQLLAVEQPLNQEQLLALQQQINLLFNHSNPALLAEWSQLLADEKHSHRLVNEVPAHLLHKIIMRLQPDRYIWLDAVVKTVIEALALLVADINSLVIKQVKWQFIFNYLFVPNNSNNNKTANTVHATEVSNLLCEQLTAALGMDDVQRLINLTQRRIALLRPPAQQKPSMRLQDLSTISAQQNDGSAPQWDAGLHINNAGQVLAAAFLPRLFSMLNLMSNGKFIDLGAADRAVHLLQFIVTGNSKTPEYDLVLNKILCGVGTSIPISAGIDVTEQEQTLIEQMLTSMIQHWKVLGSTSIAGLRETFFQRQGWLVLEEDCWRLKVKEQTFDMLLDHLPWSISLIKHGWMDKPVRVSWRNDS